jgi:hypothetical protein
MNSGLLFRQTRLRHPVYTSSSSTTSPSYSQSRGEFYRCPGNRVHGGGDASVVAEIADIHIYVHLAVRVLC